MKLLSNATDNSAKWWYLGAIIAVLLILTPSPNMVKHYLVSKGFVATSESGAAKLTQLSGALLDAPKYYLQNNTPIPVLKIDVKYKDWQLIEEDRQQALKLGMIQATRNEVNATISLGNESIKAKMRLQGDLLDHVKGQNRWSLKFSLKGKNALFSSRRFALVSPHVRINQGPILFEETLKLAGFDIVSPSYKPLRIFLNGVDWGVMYFEQGFSQELLAVNNRTEGLILRLDLRKQTALQDNKVLRYFQARTLQQNTIIANPSLAQQRKIAISLLNDFLSGNKPASDVFDIERLSQYLVMVDVYGAWHALTWNNWRWYYNPHSARFEPIQSDVAITPAPHHWQIKPPSDEFYIAKLMLADHKVKHAYQNAAKQLFERASQSGFMTSLANAQTRVLSALHTDLPLIQPFDLSILKAQIACTAEPESAPCQNRLMFDKTLHRHTDKIAMVPPWDLLIRYQNEAGERTLTITNNTDASLSFADIIASTKYGEQSFADNLLFDFPIQVKPGSELKLRIDVEANQLTLREALPNGKSLPYEVPYNLSGAGFIPRALADSTRQYSFIEVHEDKWVVKSGDWQVDSYVLTPANWLVEIEAGTTLRFASNAGLMVFGNIDVKGTSDKPVTMVNQDGAPFWRGIAVFSESSGESNVQHLIVDHAANPKMNNYQPRGSVYFVKSNANLSHLTIANNQSEDALNLVNSRVNITNLHVKNALSDAFDCDFCSGKISDSLFENIGFRSGGDGIDTSGSHIQISNVRFKNVRDKAVSGGERSKLEVDNCFFDDVNFGVVSKDDSQVTASDLDFQNVRHYALMSYSKKPYFGSARLDVRNAKCKSKDCRTMALSQTGSQLVLDNQQIESQPLNIENLYKTLMRSDKPR